MIRAVGFDLGDTLIEYKDVPLNWQVFYSKALSIVADICGARLAEDDLEKGKSILCKYNTRINPREIEVKAEQIFIEILSCWNIDYSYHLQKAIESFFTFFQRKSVVFQDTLEIMKYLKSKDIKIGVLTDVPYGMNKLFVNKDISLFEHMIDCILTSVEVGYRKPNPEGYKLLSQQLGVKPNQMIYVGNEEKDIIGAKLIGMGTVLVDRENKGLTYQEDYRIQSLLDVIICYSDQLHL